MTFNGVIAVIMAALRSRCGYIIFLPCGFFLSSIFLFLLLA